MNLITVPLTKKQLLEKLLLKSKVLVGFSVQEKGVDVPESFRHEIVLRLNLSYKFDLPMELTDFGVIATLTFSGKKYKCKIPWKSIFSIIPADGDIPYLILEDVPEQFKSQENDGQEVEIVPTSSVPVKEKPRFTVIKGEKQ